MPLMSNSAHLLFSVLLSSFVAFMLAVFGVSAGWCLAIGAVVFLAYWGVLVLVSADPDDLFN